MTAVLGISAFYHDSAAALVLDGEIVAAAQEEIRRGLSITIRRNRDARRRVFRHPDACGGCAAGLGVDLLRRQRDSKTSSYWYRREETADPDPVFRQF